MPKNVYIAAGFQRRVYLFPMVEAIESMGFRVVSRWITEEPDTYNTPEPERTHLRSIWAINDFEDVLRADYFVLEAAQPEWNSRASGGRHVETGIALAHKRAMLHLVGERENVFHWLPTMKIHQSWKHFLEYLHERRPLQTDTA